MCLFAPAVEKEKRALFPFASLAIMLRGQRKNRMGTIDFSVAYILKA